MECTPSPSAPEPSSLLKRTMTFTIKNSRQSSLDSSVVAPYFSELNTQSGSSRTTRTSSTSVSPKRSLDDRLGGLNSSRTSTTHSNTLLVTLTLSPTSSHVARTLTRGWIPSYLVLFYQIIFFLLLHPYTTPSPTLPERPIWQTTQTSEGRSYIRYTIHSQEDTPGSLTPGSSCENIMKDPDFVNS